MSNPYESAFGEQEAQPHLVCLKQFVTEIDEHYYDPDRTELEVKKTTAQVKVKDDILLQRQILYDAQQALDILADALVATEHRLKHYLNVGGENNLALSELALLEKERQQLTSGQQHKFNYRFFALNILDQTSLKMGLLTRQTTAQYLDKLSVALATKS